MMTVTEHALQTFSGAYVAAIAAHLPDWEYTMPREQDDWAYHEFVRNERHRLSYVGSDPDLQGAYIEGVVGRYRQAKESVAWHANLHIPHASTRATTFIPETLPWDERKAWPGGSINVSLKKTPEQVARELSKRLFSYYLPAYAHAIKAQRAQVAQQDNDAVLAEELASILGCRVERRNHSDIPTLYKGKAYGLRIEHGGTYLERGFSLTAAQAREFCALVAKWEREEQQ